MASGIDFDGKTKTIYLYYSKMPKSLTHKFMDSYGSLRRHCELVTDYGNRRTIFAGCVTGFSVEAEKHGKFPGEGLDSLPGGGIGVSTIFAGKIIKSREPVLVSEPPAWILVAFGIIGVTCLGHTLNHRK
jgi:hypothetical protein